MSRVRCALLFLFALCARASAQDVQVGISRDTIRVGDAFSAVVRVAVQSGTEIVFPDSLPATEDIENAGRMRMKRDSAVGGSSLAAAYPLTAWRPGDLTLPNLPVVLKTPTGERTISVHMPQVHVISVLPADTTNIQAKPPKDVIGANRLWWPWLLAALLAAIALGLLYWWWRRRKKAQPAEVIPTIMPRDRALQELEKIRAMNLLQEGLYKRYYTLVAEVLRQYMATVEPATWNSYLTTEELARKVRGRSDIAPAISVLRNADLVKFAKQTPAEGEATRDLDRAREFVTDYPPAPVSESAPAEGAAA